MADTIAKTQNYRPEIQGIRVIGALLVACFHIWGGRVSGGVDVFFVISGFLITGSLYKEVQNSQTIDVIAFWGRIAKRIAPMAYLVLALTLLAALLWMPKSRQVGFLSEVLYSAVHLENIKLMMNSVDYLAREEAPSPVQQFWALSVQVQFYAVWPFLLLATGIAARRVRSRTGIYIGALTAVFLASLAYSIIETGEDPSPAYFNTFARVWEFALGGLLAIALPRRTLPPALRWLAGWAGLALVVSCGFVLPASADFPGYVALWPTMGAALVLLSGGGNLRFGATQILASRSLVALGDISFSFYLWHWPVLIFAMLLTGRTHLGLGTGLTVIAVAFCGAYLANRWIEQPIQRSSLGKVRRWHIHAMGAAMAASVLAVTAVWILTNGGVDDIRSLSIKDYPGGSVMASGDTAIKPGLAIQPHPGVAKDDKSKPFVDKCHQDQRKADILACNYGNDRAPTKTIALVGGSHSAHWLEALEQLAHQYGWRVLSITKSACPFEINAQRKQPCIEWNENIIGYLAQLRPDVVFTTSTRPYRGPTIGHGLEKPREIIPEGYLMQWARLAEKGLTVVAVRDNPWLGTNIPECVEKHSADVFKCSRRRLDVLDDMDPSSRLASKPGNVSFIDLSDHFCDPARCLAVVGNLLVYRDNHHMTASFSRSLAVPLEERLRQVRPDLFQITSVSQESSAMDPQ
ncbi:acyltransferase [Microvirga aerilata]|uniref:Acyltransferase n=1 Tax=Microvirga aerilata TaxID=670292 RepID=A0A936ZDC3_9HYPH|nr:acyltransferase family protein [Microvirga aerilata]MBL0405042.1 acyltransferase [Microvirga aerilata]